MQNFYNILPSITIAEIAKLTDAKYDEKFADVKITNLGSLERADRESIIFLSLGNAVSSALDKSAEYKEKLKHITAGACFIEEKNISFLPSGIVPLIVADPKLAFIKLTYRFYEDKSVIKHGISEMAYIDPSVKFKNRDSVHIGPFAVIEEGVQIGENCYIGSGAKIKAGVQMGDNCTIKENAVISHTVMGNNVNIGECSVIGGNGFGWHSGSFGHIWVPQLGRVVLEDNVDVGINSAIDRGAIGDTVIGAGTKIDNLIQIGHNVKTGKNCIFAGMCGIAGSTTIGNWVLVGAGAGISGHLEIGDGVEVGARGGVIQNLPAGSKVSGYPAMPISDFLKQAALLRRMVKKRK